MTENKWVQTIKSIYQDTSTEHDLQIKRVIERIREEAFLERMREMGGDTPRSQYEERMESEA